MFRGLGWLRGMRRWRRPKLVSRRKTLDAASEGKRGLGCVLLSGLRSQKFVSQGLFALKLGMGWA